MIYYAGCWRTPEGIARRRVRQVGHVRKYRNTVRGRTMEQMSQLRVSIRGKEAR